MFGSTSLVAPNYKCRIIFEDTKLGHLDFNMFFNDPGSEVTWNIKKNNKGEYVTRWVSSVPLAQAPPAPANQDGCRLYHHSPPPVAVATGNHHYHNDRSTIPVIFFG